MNSVSHSVAMNTGGWGPEGYLVIAVGLAAVPILISIGTCYLKFSIVLGMLRSGFGTQQTPSSAMTIALSVVMSMVVMQPVIEGMSGELRGVQLQELSKTSLDGYLQVAQQITGPWREFMLRAAGENEVAVFSEIVKSQRDLSTGGSTAGVEAPLTNEKDTALSIAIGAFVLTEIKRGFLISFALLIPFFVVDLVVANLLVGLGLTMMSPVIVSLPVKILLFISADGWLLLAQSLIRGYQ